ncbi:MAG TPA: diguanylate cyclase [Solirubrobacteraceae bacterium]|jgi:diguanylate cyclase (GGDEF)-like protein/PAS domain S-box-containing protein|nr:diguanylate cyclase [Solirubrobacteraceae bacterium]
MSTQTELAPESAPDSAETARRAKSARRAATALLREHADAMIFAQSTDGLVIPVPESLGMENFKVLATDWRTGSDLCVAEDRMTIVNAWMQLKREGVAEARARMRTDPAQWWVVRMLDLRNTHGVVLTILWPTSEGRQDAEPAPADTPAAVTPRFGTRKQDEEGNVIECDEAYLQMFGYSIEEVVGQPTFERVHAEDQARLIESWIAMIATGRVQMSRVRMRRGDGSWLWVDATYHNFLHDEEHAHVLAECIDVSAEMSAQEALQEREELLRHLLEEMPDGLLQLDSERNVVYHNARLLEILHTQLTCAEATADTPDAADGKAAVATVELHELTQILTDEDLEAFEAVVERALSTGVGEDVEVEALLPFDERRHILVKVRPLARDSGAVVGVIASVQDVTDSARVRRELEQRATFDALTGAHNRSSIIAALAAELETSADTGVVYVDLDRFKSINDTFGHPAGDEVLVQVAERLKAAMRSSDALGRLGGDEFLIVLRGVRGRAVAMEAAKRISHALRGTCELPAGSIELCASVGVAVAERAVGAEELIEQADTAMYRSKQQRLGIPVLAVGDELAIR